IGVSDSGRSRVTDGPRRQHRFAESASSRVEAVDSARRTRAASAPRSWLVSTVPPGGGQSRSQRRPRRKVVTSMSQTEEAPPVALVKLLFGSLVTQMIAAAMHLEVPERLKNGPLAADAIAAAAGAEPDATYRLLRALASVGVLVEGP